MLKQQLEWDSARLQLSTEKAELKRQLDQLTNENEDIRRALKKLLALVSNSPFSLLSYDFIVSSTFSSLPFFALLYLDKR